MSFNFLRKKYLILSILLGAGSISSAWASQALPKTEGFFERFDNADIIVMGKVESIKPVVMEINGFNSVSKSFDEVRFSVIKEWKGKNEFKKNILTIYGLSYAKANILDLGASLAASLRKEKYFENEIYILFLRKFDNRLLTSNLFGFVRSKNPANLEKTNDFLALEALASGKSRDQILPLLSTDDQKRYKKAK